MAKTIKEVFDQYAVVRNEIYKLFNYQNETASEQLADMTKTFASVDNLLLLRLASFTLAERAEYNATVIANIEETAVITDNLENSVTSGVKGVINQLTAYTSDNGDIIKVYYLVQPEPKSFEILSATLFFGNDVDFESALVKYGITSA